DHADHGVPGASAIPHHTRHGVALTIFCPALQLKARAKSSLFCSVPFTRYSPGECGSVLVRTRRLSGVRFSHHTCAKLRKNRCSGVNPFLLPEAALRLASC